MRLHIVDGSRAFEVVVFMIHEPPTVSRTGKMPARPRSDGDTPNKFDSNIQCTFYNETNVAWPRQLTAEANLTILNKNCYVFMTRAYKTL